MDLVHPDKLSLSPELADSTSQSEEGSTFSSGAIPFLSEKNVFSLQDPSLGVSTPVEDTIAISGGFSEQPVTVIQEAESMDVTGCAPSDGLHSFSPVDSGAVVVQPAPTVFQQKQDKSGLTGYQQSQTSHSSASQLVPLSPFGAVDPAGLLPCKGTSISPLQEHLPNQYSFSDISILKNLQLRKQFSNLNNSADSQVFQEIFSQKSQEYTIVNTNSNELQSSFVEKFLQSPLFDKQPSCIKDSSALLNSNIKDHNAVPHNFDKSESSSTQNTRPEKTNLSYSKALAPPNTRSQVIGTAPECGVMFDRIQGVSLDTYALAIQNTIGKGLISFIGRDPGNDNLILIFLKSSQLAQELVAKGIWIRGKWLLASFFQQPATKLIVSGVMPFVPDDLIIQALGPYGKSVYPILRKIPAALRLHQFKGSFSYRREVYLVKSSKDIVIPPLLNISFLGVNYPIDISSTGVKCFICGSLYHTVNKCDKTVGVLSADSNNSSALLDLVPDKQLNKTPILETFQTSDGLTAQSLQASKDISKKSVSDAQCKNYYSQCNLAGLPALRLLEQPNKKLLINSNVNKKKRSPKRDVDAQTTSSLIENNIPEAKTGEITSGLSLFKDHEKEAGCKQFSSGQQSKGINTSKLMVAHASSANLVSETSDRARLLVSSANKKPRTSLNHPYVDAVAGFSSRSWNLVSEPALEKDVVESNSDMEDESSIPPPTSSSIVHSGDVPLTKNAVSDAKVNKMSNKQVQSVEDSTIVNTSSESPQDMQHNQACAVVANWLKKIKNLKTSARNNYMSSLMQEYPNLEIMLSYVISVKNLYPPNTAKGKKVRALLAELKTPVSTSRSTRTPKRRQTSPSSIN